MSYAATIQQLKKEIDLRHAAIHAITAAIGSPAPEPTRAPKATHLKRYLRKGKPVERQAKPERKAKRTRPARIADDDILRTLERSVIEAAKDLGVSPQTIYKRRAALQHATEAASHASHDGHRAPDDFRVD
jgi:hypothetical protein